MSNLQNNKRNVQFSVLQNIAIFFVVLGHQSGGMNIFYDWFPIYSFHMPLFLFISGYFYKIKEESNCIKYIIKKFKKFVIPYFVFNLFYCIIVIFFQKINIIDYGVNFNFNNFFIVPWQLGNQVKFNGASWFVLSLFLIQVTYIIFRKILIFIHCKNEYFLLCILLILGMIGVQLSYNDYRTGWNITLIKTLYGLVFYHIGYIYKCNLEKKDNLNNIIYFLVIFIVQFALIKLTNGNITIAMWNATFNNLKCNAIIAFITPLPGIFLWLRISKMLSVCFEKNELVEFISKNTWSIMMHHIFVFFIINLGMLVINNTIVTLNGFDVDKFRINPWYAYTAFESKNFLLFYVILGISLPILVKSFLLKSKTKNKYLKYLYNIF